MKVYKHEIERLRELWNTADYADRIEDRVARMLTILDILIEKLSEDAVPSPWDEKR